MATTLDGKVVAAAIQREVAAEAEALHHERGVTPTLAVVLVGRDPVSKACVLDSIDPAKGVVGHSRAGRCRADDGGHAHA